MTINNNLGKINISNDAVASIAGSVATGCFGVKGMVTKSMSDGLNHLLRRDSMKKGVIITENNDHSINVELHIAVNHGVNIQTVCNSIISEVTYTTERLTGLRVNKVDIFVDAIRPE